jgi:AGCS family alanine or glycine:cation symporter
MRFGPVLLGLAVVLGACLASPSVVLAQSGGAGEDGATGDGAEVGAPSEAPPAPPPSVLDAIDAKFGDWVVAPLATVLFFDLIFWDHPEGGQNLPFIVLWLVLGAVFFTLRMGFINLRGLKHAVEITAGKYDGEHDEGEVSHFQALASALSATVGLGNIAGVAIAVSLGGPGAVFWMMVAGFLGMSSKFTECTLGQMYREVDEKGRVLGGPMRYLALGVEKVGFRRLGKVLSVLFAVMCIGGSFGGGNMFQANQAFAQTARVIPFFADKAWLFGIIVAVLVGLVIIGGIKRIGQVAGAVVPLMCAVYVIAGIAILVANASAVPEALTKIVVEAFTPRAGMGGLLGVLVTGFKRAAFSNEAGIGSASIAHSAAATNEPVREGLVALLEPFIDTIIICTMTGLVVVVTGQYLEAPAGGDDTMRGVLMTSAAFESVFSWFPWVLALAVFLFAFSTMISWSYYGERCWVFLFGKGTSMVYRVIFLVFVVLGSILNLGNVVGFSDLMILGMAFPNILGLLLLNKQVANALDDYWERYKSGKMAPAPRRSA